jgi:hypothetical protein
VGFSKLSVDTSEVRVAEDLSIADEIGSLIFMMENSWSF